MTVRDLLNRSLRLIGVLASGETAPADVITDALTSMNAMIDSWKNVGFLIYQNQVQTLTLTSGTQSYTIGIGGTLNIERPVSINRVTFVQNSIEYDLEVVTEYEWSAIPNKSTSASIPQKVYFNPTFPLGTLYFWPKPSSGMSVNLYYPNPIAKFAAVGTTIDLPAGYEDLVVYGTADRIAPEYGKELTPRQNQILNETRAQIMRRNTTAVTAICDPTTGDQGGNFNFTTGRYR